MTIYILLITLAILNVITVPVWVIVVFYWPVLFITAMIVEIARAILGGKV